MKLAVEKDTNSAVKLECKMAVMSALSMAVLTAHSPAEQKAAQSDLHWVELMVALKVVPWASHWAAKLVGYSAEEKAY